MHHWKQIINVPSHPKALGLLAEKLSIEQAKQRSYRLIQHSYACKMGEIDIILLSPEQTLVFVEVKARQKDDGRCVFESITDSKQRKVRLSAEYFLMEHPEFAEYDCRLDAIGAELFDNTLSFTWLENAF
ncbi:MAG: hypothetical protein COV52_03480 [Gammaproteobacteria bacterium CG11_big_fil_rev_8_21_14_0_20_46_22]|nr:MAG: hypothetical protein COW05_09745 [Gammaproteobacteria bacterium CG12_big_fil_rev_8_21_14_0_65_46_12]PIR11535.1 MAG: hypothetical protein COV52_03480 [Gammaproteobacteria bacterium CG11_big_fil_rev_8_21_14_0_20_46_22]